MSKWGMVRLGDVGAIVTGNTPKTSEEQNYSSNDLSFFKPGDIAEDTISSLSSSQDFISDHARSQCRLIPPNSVLVTCIGIIGKVGITVHESTCNQQINAIIPDLNKCDPGFLAYAVSRTKSEMNHVANAAVVPIINKSQFSNIRIPLPPLPVQQQIADVLDRASALIEKRKAQIAKLDLLVKSQFIEMFGDPLTNSRNMPAEPLGELCNIFRGGSPRPIDQYLGGTIPWIKIGDATGGDDTYLHSTKDFIIEDGMKKSRCVKSGSLIFANCGVSLGFARIITFDGCIHDGWLSFEDIDERLNKEFLLKSLNHCTAYFRDTAPDGTQPNLNTGIMKSFRQILPPLPLQNRFADFVRAADKLKVEMQRGLGKLELLYKSLMQKCFNGEIF